MIAPSVARAVRRLLEEGKLSQRRIAKVMQVSRGTVGAIAAGKRPDYDALRRDHRDEWSEHLGPLERCPSCGGMVYMPCRACRTRSAASSTPKPPIVRLLKHLDVPLGLDLTEEHQTRYEEVRLAAMARQRTDASPAVGSLCSEAVGSLCSEAVGSLCSEAVGSLCSEAVDAWDDWDESEAVAADSWDEWSEWAEEEMEDESIAAGCEQSFALGLT